MQQGTSIGWPVAGSLAEEEKKRGKSSCLLYARIDGSKLHGDFAPFGGPALSVPISGVFRLKPRRTQVEKGNFCQCHEEDGETAITATELRA